MKLSEFDYVLPTRFIAQHALQQREKAKLLILDRPTSSITHTVFAHIGHYLRKGDCIVLNDTRVFKARLIAHKKTGGKVDILITKLISNDKACAMISHAKRTMIKTVLHITDGIQATVLTKNGSLCELEFNAPVDKVIRDHGKVPLPHYIKHDATAQDETDYQTVFAEKDGSIAAPTAGLHFTRVLLGTLRDQGINICSITLHIGPGTFKPIRVERVEDHKMDAEYYEIPDSTKKMIRNAGRVIAVGTSVCRALETYERTSNTNGMADLFIYPGYTFKIINGLITNFHMPCSTPLVLVSAFADRDLVLNAYEEAKKNGYRFLSYGDAMFIV